MVILQNALGFVFVHLGVPLLHDKNKQINKSKDRRRAKCPYACRTWEYPSTMVDTKYKSKQWYKQTNEWYLRFIAPENTPPPWSMQNTKINTKANNDINKQRKNLLCFPHLGVALHHGLDDLTVDLSRTTRRLDVHSVGVHVAWGQGDLENSMLTNKFFQKYFQMWMYGHLENIFKHGSKP